MKPSHAQWKYNFRWFALALLMAAASLSCAFAESLVLGGVGANETPQVPTAAPTLQTGARQTGEGSIAYLGLDGNVYTIVPAGGQPQAITDDANLDASEDSPLALYESPTWSPDGRRLAILKYAAVGGEPVTASLLVVEAGSGVSIEAFSSREHFPFYLSWSPDGQYVTLLSNSRGSSSLFLHLVDSDGEADRILHTGQPFYWDWSPDGRRIIVHTGGSRAQNQAAALGVLELANRAGFNAFDLNPSDFQSPAWAPHGEGVILAVEAAGGEQNLVLASAEGKILRNLAEFDGAIAFAWSPRGESLAYSIQDPFASQLEAKSLNLVSPFTDEAAEELFRGPVLAWFWSPDGQKIACFMLVNSMGKGGDRVAQTREQLRMGLFVYDLRLRRSQQLALFRPTESFLEVVPFFDQYQRSSTFWSPDSRRLVFAAQETSGVEGIYVVAADGSQAPVKIAEGVIAFWSR